MERPEALKELLEKVEAGNLPEAIFHGCHGVRGHWAYVTGLSQRQRADVFLAYNGSLDAAKALHDAVLPGWVVRHTWGGPLGADAIAIPAPYTHVFRPRMSESDEPLGANSSGYEGCNPARAWLIAILTAMIAQEEAE
jgi:hypothetical protein